MVRRSPGRDLVVLPYAQPCPSDRGSAISRWTQTGDRRGPPPLHPHGQLPRGMARASLARAVRVIRARRAISAHRRAYVSCSRDPPQRQARGFARSFKKTWPRSPRWKRSAIRPTKAGATRSRVILTPLPQLFNLVCRHKRRAITAQSSGITSGGSATAAA